MGVYFQHPLEFPAVLMDPRSSNDLDRDRFGRTLLRRDCSGLDVVHPQDLDLLLAGRGAVSGWQAEWPTLAALIETLGSAVQGMAEVAADQGFSL
jgi:hypothetical protein